MTGYLFVSSLSLWLYLLSYPLPKFSQRSTASDDPTALDMGRNNFNNGQPQKGRTRADLGIFPCLKDINPELAVYISPEFRDP